MDARKNSGVTANIPPIDELEASFAFIGNDDTVFRRNCAATLQYMIFLAALLSKEDVADTSISIALRKDLIIQTASIVESCLLYTVRQLIVSGHIKKDEVAGVEWVYTNVKELHKISDDQVICGATRTKKRDLLGKEAKFMAVNRACKKAGILNSTQFDKAEGIRKLRNCIHLLGLDDVDDKYTKQKVDGVFSDTRLILAAIRTVLATE